MHIVKEHPGSHKIFCKRAIDNKHFHLDCCNQSGSSRCRNQRGVNVHLGSEWQSTVFSGTNEQPLTTAALIHIHSTKGRLLKRIHSSPKLIESMQ